MKYIVSVVIATRNRASEVVRVINELKGQSFQDFNIIIFNDVSLPAEQEILDSLADEKTIIYNNPGPWKFEGDLKWNTHLQLAINTGTKYIYNIHDDMTIHCDDMLERFVEHMEAHPNLGAVGPTIYNAKGEIGWGDGRLSKRMGYEFKLNESYFVRTKCFLEMGLMPEKFIYYGSEFYTFAWMALNDYDTEIIDEVSITHFGGGTSTAYQNQKDYYRPRTTILLMKLFCKHESFLQKIRYFVRQLSEPRLKIRNNMKNFEPVKLVKTSFFLFAGTIAGLLIPIKFNKPIR